MNNQVADLNEKKFPRETPQDAMPYRAGNRYLTLSGEDVVVMTDGEVMQCSDGQYRYNRPGDRGRVTGTEHDFSHPSNFVRFYAQPVAAPSLEKSKSASPSKELQKSSPIKPGDIVMYQGELFRAVAFGYLPDTFDLHVHPTTRLGDQWRNVPKADLTSSEASQLEQNSSDYEYVSGINISRLTSALVWMGTDGPVSKERYVSNMAVYVNRLTAAVMGHKRQTENAQPTQPLTTEKEVLLLLKKKFKHV